MTNFKQQLIDALEEHDIEPNLSYSGRGMYGERCVAVHCGGRNNVDEDDVLDAVKDIPGAQHPASDSLGLGTVLYWPRAVTD